jgi:site-specific recombinase XerD
MSIVEGFRTYIQTELGLSKETLLAYTKDVEEFLSFIGSQELSIQLIDSFVKHLRQRRLKPSTVQRKCMSVRCLCHYLSSLDRLNPELVKTIHPIKVDRRIPDALDSKAVDALVASVEQRTPVLRTSNIRRDVAIILTLYHSGLRVSELCGLDIGDINFSHRELRVRGKGCRDRIVPTTQKCLEAIKNYWNIDRRSDINAVFVKSNGQRLTRRAVSDMLLSISCRAGVSHTTAHTLRRSCATSLMNRGVELELVQALLGHEHLSTTQNYLAVSYDRLAEVHRNCHPFGERYAAEHKETAT